MTKTVRVYVTEREMADLIYTLGYGLVPLSFGPSGVWLEVPEDGHLRRDEPVQRCYERVLQLRGLADENMNGLGI